MSVIRFQLKTLNRSPKVPTVDFVTLNTQRGILIPKRYDGHPVLFIWESPRGLFSFCPPPPESDVMTFSVRACRTGKSSVAAQWNFWLRWLLSWEDITLPPEDTKFIFECCNSFLHEKINFAYPNDHVIFFLLYKLVTIHRDVCGHFPRIFGHFAKISEDFLKLVRRLDERLQTFPERVQTFSEDYVRLPKTNEEVPIMFRFYTKKSKGTEDNFSKTIPAHVRISYPIIVNSSEMPVFFLLLKNHISLRAVKILFTFQLRRYHTFLIISDWTLISMRVHVISSISHVRISYRFYQYLTTDFYIINSSDMKLLLILELKYTWSVIRGKQFKND